MTKEQGREIYDEKIDFLNVSFAELSVAGRLREKNDKDSRAESDNGFRTVYSEK